MCFGAELSEKMDLLELDLVEPTEGLCFMNFSKRSLTWRIVV